VCLLLCLSPPSEFAHIYRRPVQVKPVTLLVLVLCWCELSQVCMHACCNKAYALTSIHLQASVCSGSRTADVCSALCATELHPLPICPTFGHMHASFRPLRQPELAQAHALQSQCVLIWSLRGHWWLGDGAVVGFVWRGCPNCSCCVLHCMAMVMLQ
jgi:hypothetical protein